MSDIVVMCLQTNTKDYTHYTLHSVADIRTYTNLSNPNRKILMYVAFLCFSVDFRLIGPKPRKFFKLKIPDIQHLPASHGEV